jgi:hypothetical protein
MKHYRTETYLGSFTFMWPRIVTNFFLIQTTDAPISRIYFCPETLHGSGSSSAHHQVSTVHSTLVYIMQVWWHILVPNVQWKTPDDGQRNCTKHVDFLDKNKFGKLVRLFGFIKKKNISRFLWNFREQDLHVHITSATFSDTVIKRQNSVGFMQLN